MDMLVWWWLAAAGSGLFLVSLIGVWIWRFRQHSQRTAAMAQELERQRTLVEALLKAATVLDRRIAKLEHKGFEIEQRQENLEQLGLNERYQDRGYGEAIQMVRRGANAQRLMEELGLSRNEAELIVMLHGAGKVKTH